MTNFVLDLDRLQDIANKLNSKNIELIVCKSSYIQSLNLEYRNIDKSTDVLSFPMDDFHMSGSIVINIDEVDIKSKLYKHTKNDEFMLLFIHGLLHLIGYDHEEDLGEMRLKEEEIIKDLKLPKSLIVRNSINVK